MEQLQHKQIESELKTFNETERTITHYISTPQVDAYNEVLVPAGMDDSTFKAVLWMHALGWNFFSDVTPPPSELVIGKSLYRKRLEDGVIAKTQFADTPLGNDIMRFNREGLLKSWSVGWKPKGEPVIDEKTKVRTYNKWNLYEYSSVVIPANAGAVNLMLTETKSMQLKGLLTFEKEQIDIKTEIQNYKSELDSIKTLLQEMKEGIISKGEFENLQNHYKELETKLNNRVAKNVEIAVKARYDKTKFIAACIDGVISEIKGTKPKLN